MADQTDSNPIRMEAAGTPWSGKTKGVRLIQWIDDNGDIANDSTLVLNINGVALTAKIQIDATLSALAGAVVWEMGPFNPGIPVSDFIVTTMGTGHLHIWIT